MTAVGQTGGSKMRKFAGPALLAAVVALAAQAAMALETVKVAENVYALVGAMEQRSPENLGNNATFGVIVTPGGVVLVDPGGSAKGAAEIEAAVAKITDRPVKVVIDTGGQDHRWFGNAYWAEQGARIIASEAAVADQKERASLQWQAMQMLAGAEVMQGTEFVHAGTRFETAHAFTLGGVRIEITHAGQAHTPGDSFVWLPAERIAFSGDIVYMDRMLGVLSFSSSLSWLGAFDALARLQPRVVVPGHGHPAPLAKARAQTRDYLVHLRDKIGALIEAGGSMIDAKAIDQSAFRHLAVFDQISRRNAQAVFAEMEFE
jgi:glyoxylase-like metal-dependent hydrolase (beta-lactamase superfamily II)